MDVKAEALGILGVSFCLGIMFLAIFDKKCVIFDKKMTYLQKIPTWHSKVHENLPGH